MVTIDYTCPDPPVGVQLADKTFDASGDLNYEIKLGDDFTDKQCVVEFGIDKVYEVKASDIELSSHPFSIDDPDNLNGIIRLKATEPKPWVYKVKISAKYKDSSGNPQFTYYTIKLIGDPCYDLLDGIDNSARIELMNPKVLPYEFGKTYTAVPDNLNDILRDCAHEGTVSTPTLDGGSATYGVTYAD